MNRSGVGGVWKGQGASHTSRLKGVVGQGKPGKGEGDADSSIGASAWAVLTDYTYLILITM